MKEVMTTMPIRKKALILLALIFINFFGSLLLTLYVSQRFVWVLFAVPAVLALFLLTLRCERCGKPVYKRSAKILGVTFTYWGGFNPLPQKCDQCGFDFGERRGMDASAKRSDGVGM